MTKKRRIQAYGKTSRIPMSLGNYMAGCREGHERATQEMIATINGQPMNPKAICEALNNHRWTTNIFKPYRPLDNGFLLIAVDPWGNEDIIRITEKED